MSGTKVRPSAYLTACEHLERLNLLGKSRNTPRSLHKILSRVKLSVCECFPVGLACFALLTVSALIYIICFLTFFIMFTRFGFLGFGVSASEHPGLELVRSLCFWRWKRWGCCGVMCF